MFFKPRRFFVDLAHFQAYQQFNCLNIGFMEPLRNFAMFEETKPTPLGRGGK